MVAKKVAGSKAAAAKAPAARAARPRSRSDEQSGSAPIMSPLGVRLSGIALRHLSYEETAPIPVPPDEPPRETDLALDAEIALLSRNRAQLTYSLVVTPDPAWRPIKVTARVSGLFEAGPEISVKELVAFANDAGGRILFPYAREVVSAVTGRGVFGPVFLDPMALQPVVTAQEVEQFATEYEQVDASGSRSK